MKQFKVQLYRKIVLHTRQSLEAVTIRNVILISIQESIKFLVYMIRVYSRYDIVQNVTMALGRNKTGNLKSVRKSILTGSCEKACSI